MKQTALVLALLFAFVVPTIAKTMKTETITLPTMQCGSCKAKIQKGVKKLKGVKSVQIDMDQKVATVQFDADRVTLAQIETAISHVGYDANDTKADPSAVEKLDACCRPH